jgi:hypothetical protein
MKKSIIYLGIALVTFTNVALAFDFQQSEDLSLTNKIQSNERLDVSANSKKAIVRKGTKIGGDPATVAPEIISFQPYKKSMEEIIAENNQIIESSTPEEIVTKDCQIDASAIVIEIEPSFTGKTMEEIILEDSKIIESTILIDAQAINVGKSKKNKS